MNEARQIDQSVHDTNVVNYYLNPIPYTPLSLPS